MFFRITNAVKKILIRELQRQFSDHPLFGNNDLKITNKYAFEERPKYAIVLKASSADANKLALDNFKGEVHSCVTLANLKSNPGKMIEWVREDDANIANLVPAGYYVVTMVTDKSFTVEPFLTVDNEIMNPVDVGFQRADLEHKNINKGSELILTEDGIRLVRNKHYTIDYDLGQVTFIVPIEEFGQMMIDYQYLGEKTGPFTVENETFNNTAIPGVILAFGNFISQGGVQVVVVYPDRQHVAQSYIGKWKLNVSFSIVAQDTDTQEQLADLLAMFLWGNMQDPLVNEGIYIENFNMSGEDEDQEEATPGEMSFLGGLSMDVYAEWEIFKPVLGVVKGVFLNRVKDLGQYNEAELAARSGRPFDSSQSGVDYSAGLQVVADLEPYVIRPVKPYSLHVPTRTE